MISSAGLLLVAVVGASFATPAAGTAVAAGLACGEILDPGRYQLTSDLRCSDLPAGKAALVINSSGGVTIDLNGYAISGPGATTGTSGLQLNGPWSAPPSAGPSVTLMNGMIRGFAAGVTGVSSRFDARDVRIAQNGTGVSGNWFGVTLHRSTIANNAGDGILGISGADGIGGELRVYDSRITGNGGNGIHVDGDFLDVERSVVSRNGAHGIRESSYGAYLNGNSVTANGQDGIHVAENGYPDAYTLLNNNADRNGGHGIFYDPGFVVAHPLDAQGNTARNNATEPQCVNIDCAVH